MRTIAVVTMLASLAACSDDAREDDAVSAYCEAVAEYVQLAQDDPTNADLDAQRENLGNEAADLLSQAESDPGSVERSEVNECANRLRQIQPGG